EIPTVSAQKEHKRDIARGVDAAQALIVAAGGKAHVLDADGGNPIVLGQLGTDPALPTVTVYNHLDVQPADQAKDGWKTDPFRCVLEGDVYRGRGTTDDKGPALAAFFGARYALELGVPANIAFLWEFEEEIGSPSFEKTIAKNKALLRTGSVIVSDTIWI